MIPIYILAIICLVGTAFYGSHSVDVYNQSVSENMRTTIVIDAGHGGEDGGAVSVSGAFESNINLKIAIKTSDLMRLLGIKTQMIRIDDRSIYTTGTTLAQKKISDLKERVRIVNQTENAVLLSLHQNYYTNEKYSGMQIFYNSAEDSSVIAKTLQNNARKYLDTNNNRKIKKASGVYLMDNVDCAAVLIECGFLSNLREEEQLRNDEYQKKIAGVITTTICNYLDQKNGR